MNVKNIVQIWYGHIKQLTRTHGYKHTWLVYSHNNAPVSHDRSLDSDTNVATCYT